MQSKWALPGRLVTAGVLIEFLLYANGVMAGDDWALGLEVYGWLPIIEVETEAGEKDKITRDDLLKDLDLAAMWAARVSKGRWSLSSDFIYFKVSKNQDLALFSNVPSLATLKKTGLQAWIVTPSIGYTVLHNDKQKIELYAGARYIWIEANATLDTNPILPGQPSRSQKESYSDNNWDTIVGVRGSYQLSGRWFIPYSLNGGAGQSDFTWSAQAALGYKFSKLDAMIGWRYLGYDLGSDTTIRELTVDGPFAGAIVHW